MHVRRKNRNGIIASDEAKTYSKDYLSHKTVKNKDVLPQWFWENNHPAIIKRENWAKAQELLASGKWGKRATKLQAMKRQFTVAKQ